MKLRRGIRFQPGFLFLTPILDLGFVLGLFIILSTPFLLQPGVAVSVPASPFLLAPQKNPAVLSITGPPKPSIFFENHEVTKAELALRLTAEAAPGTLVIKADKSATYDLLMEVATIALEAGVPVVLATETPR